jgi:hypothetical protein
MGMNYAIIEQGKVTNITLWDGVTPWTPAAGEAVACPENVGIGWTYDGETWTAPEPVAETSRWIGSHRFLFTLHSLEQQFMIDAVHTAAMGLTPAQILNFEDGAVDGNGYPLAVLRVFRLAYEQMDKLGGQVDLMSANLSTFLQAAAAVGIYGDTSEEIAAEIARIKSDTAP